MQIKHTKEFDLAYRFATETNQNIFLTGKAGTGKTTFLKYLRENSLKKTVVAAPTGVAAINARGVTLHSLFQLPFGIILPDLSYTTNDGLSIENYPQLTKIHYNKEKLNLLRNFELLIIDEASMVGSYTVDAIDVLLRYIRRNPNKPFGGVQVLFIGDLHQLPPVVKNDEWQILENYYTSIFFFDSFVLRDKTPIIIELKKIFRQKDDKFIEILNGIRNNNISEENFALLNERIKSNFTPDDIEEYIILTTHNYQSDEINKIKLNNISTKQHIFYSEIEGEFPEHILPAEKELKLKKGAQVMFLKNDTDGKQYFNGKIGTVTQLEESYIRVKCAADIDEIEVRKSEWKNIRYKINPDTKKISEEIVGTFIQYPLRLAWAITIHKSQGLTFDKIVIDAAKAFATGQVYVALSRCTSLEGLILRTPIYKNSLGAHKDFKDWQNKNWNANLSELLIESRENFILDELQNIFTWKNWYYLLKELNEFLIENKKELTSKESNAGNISPLDWLSELMEKQKKLYEVSGKFKIRIIEMSKINSSIEENEILQKRLKEGAEYFSSEIMKWNEKFYNHPIKANTKKLSAKIDSLLEATHQLTNEILQKINYCKRGFILNEFLNSQKQLKAPIKNVKTSYIKKEKESTVLETVILYRQGKDISQIADERNLVQGTIEGHLAKAISDSLFEIEEIMPIEEAKKIATYFPKDLSSVLLSVIKEKTPKEITYGKLRIVLAWLEKQKTNY